MLRDSSDEHRSKTTLAATLLKSIQAGLKHILSQGFRESCCLCNRSADRGFCKDCWRQILSCQQFTPLPTTAPIPPMLAWGRYEGGLKRAIGKMKYQNQPLIATRLGEELGLRWLQSFPQLTSFQVIPIPLHRDRQVQRGYNQAELIARRFSQVVGVPCRNGLVRIYQTQAQYSLDPAHRAKNLEGAFTLNSKFRHFHQPVLLVDDIFTTGATIGEARQVLASSKLKVLGTAVVAQAILDRNLSLQVLHKGSEP